MSRGVGDVTASWKQQAHCTYVADFILYLLQQRLATLAPRYSALRERDYSELNTAKEENFLDMIFIYCNIQKEKKYAKNTKTKNTQNRHKYTKQENKYKDSIKKHTSSNKKKQREANNNDTTYCTEPTYSYVTINQ